MCFAPQRRPLFRHLNFQKSSDTEVFCTFWLRNVLRATTAVHFFDISTSKSRPTLRCFVHFDFEMCFAPQRRALFRHLNFQKWPETGVFCTFWLRNVLRATTACTFSTSQLPKVVRHWGVLYILTSKCASRHNGVHFFDISTSKSGPKLVCFVHFDFEMCFAPQWRAFFQHLNCQKWSNNGVFCTFSLGNVLRATTACTFSSLVWPARSAPAALVSLLFRPSGATNHWKNSVSRLSSLFAHLRRLSSDSFSSTVLSLLSASSLLCFASVHIVGSLTSKLPSTKGADNCPAVQRHKRKYRKGGMRRKSVNAKAGRQTVAWIQTPV